DLLLVNANEQETVIDISPIEEAKVSLIDETAIDQELYLSYEQVDANEHETSVEFAAYEEAQESLILGERNWSKVFEGIKENALTDPQRVRTPAV
ncbi:hypothetical protein Tco_0766053, partial [Tanacetum coccineum]